MMDDKTFRAFLDLMMCSDPWPVKDDGSSHTLMNDLALDESSRRGYDSWYVAFHEFKLTEGE